MTASPVRPACLAAHDVGYQTPGGTSLLSGVSLRVKPGRILAVLGPNGAGKTTLLRLLTGESRPTGGEVMLDSRPLGHWPAFERARRLAVLPQQSTLAAALTGLEVALLGRSPYPSRGDSADDAAVAHAALALMDAAHLAGRIYPSLSGGEKSRVQAARTLSQVLDPVPSHAQHPPADPPARFLLLDEPTAALDCAHQHQFLSQLRHVAHTRHLGVLVILHDLNLAAQYADDLLVLARGRAVACGPTREVFDGDLLSAVFGLPLLVVPHPRHGWPIAIPN